MSWNSWASTAEKAGYRLLELRPDLLIIVEGTSSANDLSGGLNRPVFLALTNRVVYSSHVYGWLGWGSLGGSYSKRSYDSFAVAMQENWG